MKELSRIEFPRSLTCADAEEPPMLCIFSDASQYAFDACAYSQLRVNDDQYQVRLIAAKSRVATLKQLLYLLVYKSTFYDQKIALDL